MTPAQRVTVLEADVTAVVQRLGQLSADELDRVASAAQRLELAIVAHVQDNGVPME